MEGVSIQIISFTEGTNLLSSYGYLKSTGINVWYFDRVNKPETFNAEYRAKFIAMEPMVIGEKIVNKQVTYPPYFEILSDIGPIGRRTVAFGDARIITKTQDSKDEISNSTLLKKAMSSASNKSSLLEKKTRLGFNIGRFKFFGGRGIIKN